MSKDPSRVKNTMKRKLVVVGNGFCGKTCLLLALAKGEFKEHYVPTIFETDVVDIEVDAKEVELELWDTAGQEDYDRLRPLSYPDTDALLMIYSVTDRDSYDDIADRWVPEVRHFCSGVPFLLVATKVDLRREQSPSFVSETEGEELAERIGAIGFVETSAKEMINVQEAFERAVRPTLEPPRSRKQRTWPCSQL